MMRVLAFWLILLAAMAARAETYVVSVGIGKYADPKVQTLTKTEADAKAIAEFYKKGTPNVVTITGHQATKAQILKSLKSRFARAKAGDKIVFFFSGHGYPGGFCPYDMVSLDGGLRYSDVVGIMQQSKATGKFIFADACHSGAIRQSGGATEPQPGNVLLFMSSRGNEYSVESPYMANGYFTKYLLRGLGGGADANKDRRVTARELFNFVSEGVKSHTRGRQHPVMWGRFDHNLPIVEYRPK